MYNKAIIIGRLVADPELRQTPNGISVTTIRVAVDRPYSKNSERQADFLDVTAWRSTAEFICRYFSKGKPIMVEGAIQTRSYTDKNDQKRTAWEIVADNVNFVLGDKSGSQGGGGGGYNAPPPVESLTPPAAPAPAYSSGSPEDFAEIDDDGDLPF